MNAPACDRCPHATMLHVERDGEAYCVVCRQIGGDCAPTKTWEWEGPGAVAFSEAR